MTTKKEQKRAKILHMMRDLPIVSTEQISIFFKETGSPQKRASEFLRTMEKEKLIEGKRREIGKPKVWRLTSDGRSLLKVRKRPLPLNSLKIDHALAIGDVWLSLVKTGKLHYFKYEPIDPFKSSDRERVYAPDAFFIYDRVAYLLEVQLSPLSTLRWGDKWNVASRFFEEGHYKKASWQVAPNQVLKPSFVVISNQSKEVIQGGSNLELIICEDIQELIKIRALN